MHHTTYGSARREQNSTILWAEARLSSFAQDSFIANAHGQALAAAVFEQGNGVLPRGDWIMVDASSAAEALQQMRVALPGAVWSRMVAGYSTCS
jgi:hypothetical protein